MKHTMKLLLAAVSLFAAIGSWAALESVTNIPDLNVANPTSSDPVSQADDHIRNIKTALRNAHMVIDRAYAEYTTNASLTTVLPLDDTIPQNTEGTQIISVSLTPKSVASRVRVRFQGGFALSAAGNGSAAVFSSASANALVACTQAATATDLIFPLVCEHEYAPSTTSAITFTVRVGPSGLQTMRMNGATSGRFFGGVGKATLVVEEIS